MSDKRVMTRLRNQRGVAMVTVLLVGAVLTVVSSTAAFLAIDEFRATTDDLKATQALSYAEAGLDRVIVEIRRERLGGIMDIALAGCTVQGQTYPIIDKTAFGGMFADRLTGAVGAGTYDVAIRRAEACPSVKPKPNVTQKIAITSVGTHPQAVRRVEQIVQIDFKGLPIGLYAEERVLGGGTGDVTDISLITPGTVDGRDRIHFAGFDPFYTLGDFFPDTDPLGRYSPGWWDATERTRPIPAAAHAGSWIRTTNNTQEHPPQPRCSGFNGNKGTAGQELWDQSEPAADATLASGCANWTPSFGATPRFPPTADFKLADARRLAPTPRIDEETYDFLRGAAQSSGLYCVFPSSGNSPTSCSGAGTAMNNQNLTDGNLPSTDGNVVVYIEFPAGGDPDIPQRTISLQITGFPLCTVDTTPPVRNLIVVVRNGSLKIPAGADKSINGSLIAPEGTVEAEGDHTTIGTVIARVIRLGGTGEFKMAQCWLDNMSMLFFNLTSLSWRELDR